MRHIELFTYFYQVSNVKLGESFLDRTQGLWHLSWQHYIMICHDNLHDIYRSIRRWRQALDGKKEVGKVKVWTMTISLIVCILREHNATNKTINWTLQSLLSNLIRKSRGEIPNSENKLILCSYEHKHFILYQCNLCYSIIWIQRNLRVWIINNQHFNTKFYLHCDGQSQSRILTSLFIHFKIS